LEIARLEDVHVLRSGRSKRRYVHRAFRQP